MNPQINWKKSSNNLFDYRRSRSNKNQSSLLFIILVVLLTCTTLLAIETQKYLGKINLGDSLFYTCRGEIIRKDKQVTKSSHFFDENGKLILTETVTFNEDNFELISLSSSEKNYGRVQKIERDGENFRLNYKKDFADKLNEYTMDYQPLTLHGSNLPVFLSDNLDRLGEDGLSCRLILVPRKMKIEMKFVNKGQVKVNGQECYEIQMDAANILLKPLVKTHYFYFGVNKPHLLYKYIGTIAPIDAEGNDLWGTINFSYH